MDKIDLCLIGGQGKLGVAIERFAKEDPIIGSITSIDKRNPLIVDPKTSLSKTENEVVLFCINNPLILPEYVDIASEKNRAIIVATTGLNEDVRNKLRKTSERIPILISDNFSRGVAITRKTLYDLAKALPADEYDVEIIHYHHRKKEDQPSGTSRLFAEAICEARGWDFDKVVIYGREGSTKGGRPNKEICINSVSGGTVAGFHKIIFFGPHESMAVEHNAESRDLFAHGAVYAIKKMAETSQPGYIFGL